MRIKKLEIHGFKSFADKATLMFGDGISGVVGPNGCGKSNVVDAIRWCMGEMSAKHLRGKAMQDVIFAGSDSRGPLGLAEVTLTFHNDGNVPPAFAAYEEIAVTRRLHRDGTSEYLINNTQARLRDITDFFLGTGVGTRAYSIIEQGRIGFIVNAKPEERRSLIEEVAGITKFKARKKAAERRMEATQQNLTRVNDIISELERQLGSLRRQARKAERYRELREELRDLELHAASVDLLKMAAVERYQIGERQKLEAKLGDTQGAMAVSEATIEADKLRLLEEERRLQAEQEASAEIDAKLAALERDLEHWTRQQEDAHARAQEGASDSEEANRRLDAADREEEQLESQVEVLSGSFGEDQAKLESVALGVDGAQAAVAQIDAAIEQKRGAAVEQIHGAAQQNSILATLQRQRADTERRLEQATRDVETVAQSRVEVEARLTRLASEIAARESQLAGWRDEQAALRDELGRVKEERADAAERVQAVRDELSERRSRLSSLEEIARRLEGFSDGVRTLMGEDGQPVLEGIRTLVPEIMEVPEELEGALEAALGERLQYLVVAGHEVAKRGIEHLRAVEGGRGGFVPIHPWTRESIPASGPGIRGRAIDLVRTKPGFEAAAESVLGDIVVVDSLEVALGPWPGTRPRTVVTLAGEVVADNGAVVGGVDGGAGVLANRREIRELTEVVAALEARLGEARAALAEKEERVNALSLRLDELDGAIRRAEIEAVEQRKDQQAALDEQSRLDDRDEVLRYELEQHREELQRIDVDEGEARTALDGFERAREAIEMEIAVLQEQRQTRASELEERSQELTRLRVDLAAREEKIASAKASLGRLDQTRSELRERMERGRAQAEEASTTAANLREQIERAREEAATISVLAQQKREALSEARGRFEAERERLGVVEQKIREDRRQGELVQEALLELKMDLQRINMERNQLIAHVRDRHDVNLLDLLTEYHTRPEPGPEDVKRRKELDRQIKNMGPINLTAIDECAEIEQRFDFLTRQRDDLNEALENLRRAIQRINKASRERFKEAYESVNEMFQKVYPRLFRGGLARLELTNAEDLLEAGVEIVAQPPGKKLQNVNLMSGGEKALTATAFIFSIFLIKPSPFCILDEVDAPLDEANVGRFNEMLREISAISQFIVITHNKTTMTQADKLYGITMQEPGMSTVVPVDLDQFDEKDGAAA